jgi:small subunit ribosomal protein S3Ae
MAATTAAKAKKSKVVDKWKSKQWYTVLAPTFMNSKEISEIVSSDEENLKNRIISISVAEATGQMSQSAVFTALKFRISEVKGRIAYTKLIGHEVAPSFMRTLSRRNRSLINFVKDVKTKDDTQVRLKLLAITGNEVSGNTKKNLYNAMLETVKKACEDLTYDQLMDEVVSGRFATRVFGRLKQITSMRRVDVRKSQMKEVFA